MWDRWVCHLSAFSSVKDSNATKKVWKSVEVHMELFQPTVGASLVIFASPFSPILFTHPMSCRENLQSKTLSTDWALSSRLLGHWWRTTHPTPHKLNSRAVSDGFSRTGWLLLKKKKQEKSTFCVTDYEARGRLLSKKLPNTQKKIQQPLSKFPIWHNSSNKKVTENIYF